MLEAAAFSRKQTLSWGVPKIGIPFGVFWGLGWVPLFCEATMLSHPFFGRIWVDNILEPAILQVACARGAGGKDSKAASKTQPVFFHYAARCCSSLLLGRKICVVVQVFRSTQSRPKSFANPGLPGGVLSCSKCWLQRPD